ncbi:radical SAM protein [Dyella sp.]|uniref:radical SAM protein n=1 Tax=Dyella sp. TaxID=1869338 RepID=UPI002ED4FA74
MNRLYDDHDIAEALSPKSLELILLPTEKCNFRCTYCYEDFVLGKMPENVINAIKNLIENRTPHIDNLSLSWFGGEPLLAKDIITSITDHAHACCSRHGTRFHTAITTNGFLLTRELVTQLCEKSSLSMQITLDGFRDWHDKTRVLANGRGSFDKLWSNLKSLKTLDSDFSITLRLHLHSMNIDSMKNLYKLIEQEFGNDHRFHTYFHKVSDLGGNTVNGATLLSNSDYLSAMDEIRGKTNPNPDQPISELHLKGYICYAARPNSLLIRSDGTIGKCTVALNSEKNRIGKINDDGSLVIDHDKLHPWFSGYSELSRPTLSCPLATMKSRTHAIQDKS